MGEFWICFGVLIDGMADELGVACGTKRGMEDEVFSLNNLVAFPFTGLGKTEENTSLWRKLSFV